MACSITISKNEDHVFSTEIIPFRLIQHFLKVFRLLGEKFPQKKGYDLTVHHFPRHKPEISREDFKKAADSKDWRMALDFFVDNNEFQAFRATKTLLEKEEFDISILDEPPGAILTARYSYQGDALILQMGEENPRFIVSGDGFYKTTDLYAAEQESYRMYLRLHDAAPYEEF
jgi:hypothetical protein